MASGFQLDKTQPIDEGGLENSLIVKILKGEGKSLEILYRTFILEIAWLFLQIAQKEGEIINL